MEKKYNLFEQILVKTSKEYGYYNLLKKCYKRERLIVNTKNLKNEKSLLTFQQLFGIDSTFSNLTSLWCCVNNIVFELIRKRLIDFLNEHNALEGFTTNLINFQDFTFKPKVVKNINDYINNCIYYNICPLNLISIAFSWRDTNENYNFCID